MSLHSEAARDVVPCTARRRADRRRRSAAILIGLPIGLALLLAAQSIATAQADDGWLGRRVVPKHSDFELRVDDQPVEPDGIYIYRVEQVKGPSLRLRAAGQALTGWAPVEEVVPIDQAIAFFTDSIRDDPASTHDYISRALVWKEKGDFDKAIADFNEVIRLDPARPRGYVFRAIAWYDKKEYDKAIADFTEAIRLKPDDYVAYFDRGNVWKAKKEYDKAIADYDRSLQLDPDGLAYNNRGNTRKLKGEYDRAVADYDQALRLDPRDAHAHNSRAWLLATCPIAKYRDGKKAVESATRACELLGWDKPNNLDTLAAACAEAGDFDAAVKWQSTGIELLSDQESKDDYRTRLELYRAKKPFREASP
jgi:tetratricopeptide (TPR) repeat protein